MFGKIFQFFLLTIAFSFLNGNVNAITVDNVTSVADFTAGGARSSAINFSHTILGSNEVLYVGVTNNRTTIAIPTPFGCSSTLTPGGTVTNISFGSQTNFERLTTRDTGASAVVAPTGCVSVEVFRLKNPNPGTSTISVTIPSGGDYVVIGAISFLGVDTSTPAVNSLEPAAGTNQNPAVTIAGSNTYNGIALDVIGAEFASQDIALGAMPNQMRQWRMNSDPSPPPPFYVGAGGTKSTIAGTPSTLSWQLAQPGGSWALGAVALKETATASPTTVSGKVVAPNGRGIYKAVVYLTSESGEKRMTATNPFGYFRFDGVDTGKTYVISASSKSFRFSSRALNSTEGGSEMILTAQP